MKKGIEEKALEIVSKNRIQKDRLKNKLVGIIIFASTYLLCFSTMFFLNTFYEMKNISENRGQVVGVMLVIVIIIALSSGTAIRSIIYISFIQQTKEFAKLKMLGAVKKQLKKLVIIERRNLIKKSVPLATILAIVSSLFVPGKNYLISILGFILADGFILCVVVLAYKKSIHLVEQVSPIEVVQGMNNLKITREDKGKAFLSPLPLAFCYATESTRQFKRILLSLTLSGILMFSVFSVMKSIDIEQLASYPFLEESSYILSLNSDLLKEEDDYSYNELMENNPMTDELYTEICGYDDLENIYRLKILECEVINPKTNEITDIEGIESILNYKEFEKKITKGDMPVSVSDSEDIPVIVNISAPSYNSEGLSLNIGDRLSIVYTQGKQSQNKNLYISGFIEEENTPTVLFTSDMNISKLTNINCDLNWYICTSSDKMGKKLENIVSRDNRLSLISKKTVVKEYKSYFDNFITAITIFVVIASVFAFLNLFNVCIVNVIIRQKEYTIFESIGMTKKQIEKMIVYESLIYILPAFVASCILGIPIGIFICNKIAEISGVFYIHYNFPILFILVYTMFIIAIQQVIVKYQNTIIFKDSIVDRLRK
ncbi:MAG: ABC transporter permease [Lachnospiraceae bacterium]|nr:ABC transporter permease [Lachnospiraceae bacterium]